MHCTVTGLGIEVSSVCGVLAMIGVIEPANDTAASALEAIGSHPLSFPFSTTNQY